MVTGPGRPTCPACAAPLGADAARCPSCGLVVAGRGPLELPPSAGPGHVDVILGATPAIETGEGTDVAGERAPEVESPERGVDFRTEPARRYGWIVALVVAAGLVALVLSLRSLRGPPGADTDEIRHLAPFLDSPALDDPPAPPPLDADARLAEIERELGVAPGPAPAKLPAAGSVTVHEFGEAFVAAITTAEPWFALRLGAHPHPKVPREHDAAAEAAMYRLARDALREIRQWPGRGALSTHDRTDLDLLEARMEAWLREGAVAEHDVLAAVDWELEFLTILRDVPCCPPAERAEAALAVLESEGSWFREVLRRLRRPARAEVLAVAAGLDDDLGWIFTYADGWQGIDAEQRSRLREASRRATEDVERFVRALREEVLPRADGPVALGRERFDRHLRRTLQLPYGARGLYERALKELRRAEAERIAIEQEPDARASVPYADEEAQIDRLARRIDAWLPSPPAEPGLRIVRGRDSTSRRAQAIYLDAGMLAGAAPGVVHVEPPEPTDDLVRRDVDRTRRLHVLAHETYPGHRMEALVRRGVCAVRRFADDRAFTEGWATYAEDLVHETGDCGDGFYDRWVRAVDRASRARMALHDVLLATGAAGPQDLLPPDAPPMGDAELADLGSVALAQGYSLLYFAGHEAITALRAAEEDRLGARFDLREFHRRLLAEGPIPPHRIAALWTSEGR